MIKRFLSLIALLVVCSVNSLAADTQLGLSGNGTAASPYLLKDARDIVALAEACAGVPGATSGANASHYQGVYFALAGDIDMSGVTGFYGIGTAPMGSASGVSWYFAGIIDGKGYTIRNLNINGLLTDDSGVAVPAGKNGSRSYVGLIGVMKNGGAVKNIHLDSTCRISGYGYTGSIVGQAEGGTSIEGCTSAAQIINVKKNSGGIAGYLKGSSSLRAKVSNCVFTGSVMESTEAAGGIAGRNERSDIANCVNLGKIEVSLSNGLLTSGNPSQGAGIAAYNYFGTVSNCLNAGLIKVAYQKIGGIVAYNANADASVESCVNLGRLESSDKQYSGAIVGHNFKSGSASSEKFGVIKNCYYDSQMWGEIPGYQVPEGCVTACATLDLVSGNVLPGLDASRWTFSSDLYPYPNIALASEMIKEAASTYVMFAATESAMDFTSPAHISTASNGIKAQMAIGEWFKIIGNNINPVMPQDVVTDTIRLTNGTYRMDIPVMNVPVSFEGEGTEANPYLISSKKHLMTLAERCNGDRMEHFDGVWFRQTADIDMMGDQSFKGIASKCINAFNSELSYYFSGKYDGGGYSISNIDIEGVVFSPDGVAKDYTKGSTGNVGLFGALGKGAEIRNVKIRSAKIAGYYNVGGITGYLSDNAVISGCEVEADILCYNKSAGGIVGSSNGAAGSVGLKITDCIFYGSVKSNSEIAGGIIGYNHAEVRSCVNLGNVSVSQFNKCVTSPKLIDAGGIVGSNGGNIHGCLNMGNITTGWTQAGGIAGSNTNGYKKGNITDNISTGQVHAQDLVYAGALLGLDYRINTSQSSKINISNNYYDNQACRLHGSENLDKEGLSGRSTADLTSGKLNPIENWNLTQGFYPVPSALAANDLVKRASATFITIQQPFSLYDFGSEGHLSSSMPVTAELAKPSDVFSIEGNVIRAGKVDRISEAEIILKNGNYTRVLTLTKIGSLLPGEGTLTSPYLISSPGDFNAIADFSSSNNYDFNGVYFALTSDLDFTGIEIHQLGLSGSYFNGIIDGNGHVIKHVTLAKDDKDDKDCVGIFGYIGENAIVKNLKIDNSRFSGGNCVGAFAGHCMGMLEGCSTGMYVDVSGRSIAGSESASGNEVGGLVGRAYPSSKMIRCTNAASVVGNKMVGGIIGANRDTYGCVISDCVNIGEIIGTAPRETVIQGGQEVSNYVETMTGGIAGRFTGEIQNCVNEGDISSSICNGVGGIVGKAFIKANLTGCTNKGLVNTAYSYAGGIVGVSTVTAGDEISTIISDCSNEEVVSGMSSIGGIVGVAANGCLVKNCRNIASVKPKMGRAAGIAGEISQKVSISDCYNAGEIEASMLAAGIVGDVPSKAVVTIERCFNTADIKAGANGGAAGILNTTSGTSIVNTCYNTGNITAARYAGGIAGKTGNTSISRSYSAGTVKSTSSNPSYNVNVGNIVGETDSQAKVDGCCYLTGKSNNPADAPFDSAHALDARSMFDSKSILGDGFVYNDLCLPMIAGQDTIDVAKVNSVYYEVVSSADSGLLSYTLGVLPGVIWSATHPFSIEDNSKAVATADGSGTITATCGNFSKTYAVSSSYSGADITETDADEVVSTEYYSLSGQRISNPDNYPVCLKVMIFRDGSRKTLKINRQRH